MLRGSTLLLIAVALPAQAVLQVGPAGYPQIADAILAAQPGDVIEVAAGWYLPFVLDKALVLRAAPGATVSVLGGFNDTTRLRPPVGTVAHVARIQFLSPWQHWIGAATRVERGSVWFEDCIFESPPYTGVPGLGVYAATAVLRRCVCVGNGWAYGRAAYGNDGLRAVGAQVFATDCVMMGCYGGFDIGPAGNGLTAVDSLVQLVDCQLGGGSAFGTCVATSPGDGTSVSGLSDVSFADCRSEGGASTCATGAAGLRNTGNVPVRFARTTFLGGPVTNGSGPAVVGPTSAVPLLGAAGDTVPLVRGGAWQMDYRTEPNWPIGVFLGDQLAPHADPVFAGPVLLPAGGAVALALLVADAQGAANYATTLPNVPAALGATLFVEAVTGVGLPLLTAPPVGGLLW